MTTSSPPVAPPPSAARPWPARARRVLAERRTLVLLGLRAAPRDVATYSALAVLRAVFPAAVALASGAVAATAVGRDADGRLWQAAALLAALVLLSEVAPLVAEQARSAMARQVDGYVRSRVRRLLLAPRSIAFAQEREFQDQVARACDPGHTAQSRTAGTAVTGQYVFLTRVLSAVLAAGVVSMAVPWLGAVVLALAFAVRAIIRRQWMHLSRLDDGTAGEKRRYQYVSRLMTDPAAAKEVRVHRLGDWLLERWSTAASTRDELRRRALHDVLWRQGATVGLTLLMVGFSLLVPGVLSALGQFGVATLTQTVVAAWAVFTMSGMGSEAFDIDYGIEGIRAFQSVEDRVAEVLAGEEGRSVASPIPAGPPELRFEGVTFRYPNAPAPVIDSLDLTLPAGQVTALVGVNGAGKSTITRLLTGLFPPESGRVVAYGRPLPQLDQDGWQRRVAVLPQNFARFPGSLADNVALGAPESRDDVAGIRRVLQQVGLDAFVAGLPAGTDTALWTAEQGTGLSGGQWQRLALARVLFAVLHGREVLILDEPTAHLDVLAEGEFFETVLSLVQGVTVLLISHRLSTVRRADQILLLDRGRIVEAGSHDELLTSNGAYATLFRLQGSRFGEEEQ